MSRKASTGKYTVPAEVLALKPKGFNCTVKAISVHSKTKGTQNVHYYVYEIVEYQDPKNPNRKKFKSGNCLGKIEGGTYCPNAAGRSKHGQSASSHSEEATPSEAETGDGPDVCHKDEHMSSGSVKAGDSGLPIIATNMNLDLKDIDLQVKNYGEYAIVLSSTGDVFERLNKFFSTEDSKLIYVLGIIYFIQEYTPASYIKDIFDQSVLSSKWPFLGISENKVGKFLKLIGQHPVVCEKYAQSLIDDSSGLTAIDGHVILSCSKRNDLADYGNKYSKIGNKQINILEAYDVKKETPLTSKTYEGGLLDKTSVKDLLNSFNFPERTVFLIDAGFYSEDDMTLYRDGGKHFVIPIPDSCVISKSMQKNLAFSESFNYTKEDENGISKNDRILFTESTVDKLEDAYQRFLEKETERKNEKARENSNSSDTKPKKHYTRKITRSEFGSDRVIMFRDEEMHDKMAAEFLEQIGIDDFHSEENFNKLSPYFGIIVLRTNLSKKEVPAQTVYENYKQRWKLETHYNFVENIIRFYGLKTDDYYVMQGLSFIILVVGQIKAGFKNKQKASTSKYVNHLSTKECLVKAARLKLSQHQDKKWYLPVTTQKTVELITEMGVDMASDLKRLNVSQF